MLRIDGLPAWAALPAGLLLLAGVGLPLTVPLGLLRLGSPYQRMHAPTLGIGCILAVRTLFFTVVQARLVLHAVLIAVSMVATKPVTLRLPARARHRTATTARAAERYRAPRHRTAAGTPSHGVRPSRIPPSARAGPEGT